ncbi:MAG: peptidase C11 [Lachnospiraceae bacterium]|nr:peptidase C11 [Lachnospiraceae bacterium]
MAQAPRGRDRKVTGKAKDIYKRGDGLGTGPVGSGDGYGGRKTGSFSGGSGSGGGKRSGGGKMPLLVILLALLLGGGGGLGGLLGGSSGSTGSTSGSQSGSLGQSVDSSDYGSTYGSGHQAGSTSGSTSSGSQSASMESYINSLFGGDPTTFTTSGSEAEPEETPDSTVAEGARAKRTKILGGGKDAVTIMVYMCGTDLESRSGMGTSDLSEMTKADLGNLNVIVYTGGCRRWQNNVVSSSVNQIYQVKNGGLSLLVKDAGTGAMTDPSTLASFIKWCSQNYPANRNELILWDHGGGSVSGYGYDEKNARASSMNLANIGKALKAAGTKFDFIGFDACLMATAENALMLDSYGDYLIASEETEPGVGWYYTDWLTKFAANTSMETTQVGKLIADDFVRVCATRCRGQQTTLSVIDLAEFAHTVPNKLTAFSRSISSLIEEKQYTQVASARNKTREFARSTRIDQVDLVDLARNMGTDEGTELAKVLKAAVKYNTYNNISRAEGVSIYFPYQSISKVDSAVSTMNAIGMDSSYGEAIKEFAALQTSGQVAAGGTNSPYGSLLGDYGIFGTGGTSASSSGGYSADYSSDALSQLLGAFLGGDYSSISGLSTSNASYLSGRALGAEETAAYISEHHFDGSQLIWQEEDGAYKMTIADDQWQYVHGLDLNMFYDDGEGYIDLGLDNIYSFDESGRLVANTDKVWLSINDQIVPYYHENTEDDGENYAITGRIPVLLNGERAELIVVFDNDDPQGRIEGARTVYTEGETETAAKTLTGLENGDKIDFICDYYTYDGDYQDSFLFGDQITVTDDLAVGNSEFSDQGSVMITYRFRDLYNRDYWSAPIVVG